MGRLETVNAERVRTKLAPKTEMCCKECQKVKLEPAGTLWVEV